MIQRIVAPLVLAAVVAAAPVAFATNPAGKTPGGCRNPNAAIHNPNCGGSAPNPQISIPPTNHQQPQIIQPVNQLPPIVSTPTPATIVITPQAPQTFTGYGTPPVITTGPPQTITGYRPVTPQAPQTFVGYGTPPAITTEPPQTITGYAPYNVPPQPPQPQTPSPMPGYVAYPDYVGPRNPSTGYPIVTANPPQTITGYAPYNVPPQQQQTPSPKPGQGAQIVIDRPQPLRPTPTKAGFGAVPVTVDPKDQDPVGPKMTTSRPGRQKVHAVPTFEVGPNKEPWTCEVSGHYRRWHLDDDGIDSYFGAMPGQTAVSILRDVPAWHDLTSHCLIAIKRPVRNGQASGTR